MARDPPNFEDSAETPLPKLTHGEYGCKNWTEPKIPDENQCITEMFIISHRVTIFFPNVVAIAHAPILIGYH